MQGQKQFALELYDRLGQKADGNLCFAPSSIQMALAMTYAGARGQTATQMAEVLYLDLPSEALHAAFADQLKRLHQNNGIPEKIRSRPATERRQSPVGAKRLSLRARLS
jgi:serine protease inhibitor